MSKRNIKNCDTCLWAMRPDNVLCPKDCDNNYSRWEPQDIPKGEMHDSGERQDFATGAVRDTATGKPRIDLVSPFAMRRLGQWCGLGAAKYSDRNWEAGMPMSRVVASLCRHVESLKAGDTNEDHAAAVMWNAMALMHYEEMISRGVLPAELADMPDYGKETV